MNTREPNLELQVGGAINPRKHLYIVREDVENNVFELLQRSEYCNILSSRQVGKSSLMINVALRLQQQGIRVASIEIAGELGSPENAEQWYLGFLGKIVRSLRINVDVKQWWSEQEAETANQRLLLFLRTELFAADQAPVVIFVDEIDHSLNLPYTDDFFTAIRTMYNQRATEPAFEKVAFCLIGVASPNELVKQRRTTAYNVGETVELRDFDIDRDDLSSLVRFLSEDEEQGKRLLAAVLDWTGGQPYLTTWLCREVKRQHLQAGDQVAKLVGETFSNFEKVSTIVHFQQITRFLGERILDQLAALGLYERILRGKTVRDEATPTHMELKLSGIVRRNEAGNLVVRNRIYQNIFSLTWIRQTKPGQSVRNLRRVTVVASMLLMIILSGVAYNGLVLEPVRENRRNATAGVESLLVAEISKVAVLTADLAPYRQWADPLLQTCFRESADIDEKLRAGLALLPVDSGPVDYLREQLLTAPYDQIPPILDAISVSNRSDKVISPLWGTLASGQDPARRLRAALTLARFDPPTGNDDLRWISHAEFLADQMIDSVIENPSHLSVLTQALRPVFPDVLLDPLTQRFLSEKEVDRRKQATDILAEYAADKPQLLAELIEDADQQQFAVLFPVLAKHTDIALQQLQQVLAESAAKDGADQGSDTLPSRQANAVIALLRMGGNEQVWSFLRGLPESATRSYVIERLERFGVEPEPVVNWLTQQQDVSVRQTLLLGLCQYNAKQIAAVGSRDLIDRLLKWYEFDPDPGIHVTSQWLLREMNQEDKLAEISSRLKESSPVSNLESFENDVGMTMVKLPAGPFRMGSPPDEPGHEDHERQHVVILTRSYYVGKHEVTQAQYQEIMDGNNPSEFKNAGLSAPVETVSWNDAIDFCRLLTVRDRASGKLPTGFVYTLPTEAQWEFACRSGTTGAIYHGDLEVLGERNAPALDPIAWYSGNSGVKYDGGFDSSFWKEKQQDHQRAGTHHVGQKKPNAWGLHDMLGNVWEWCRDNWSTDYPSRTVTDPTGPPVTGRERVLRGGTWGSHAIYCRSASRNGGSPEDRDFSEGFRVAAVRVSEL